MLVKLAPRIWLRGTQKTLPMEQSGPYVLVGIGAYHRAQEALAFLAKVFFKRLCLCYGFDLKRELVVNVPKYGHYYCHFNVIRNGDFNDISDINNIKPSICH